MTQKHTPTPWKVYQFGGVQIGQEDTGEAICSMWGDKSEGDANAAHIVKCVNMHDGLVEALRRLKQECEADGLDRKAGYDCWISIANETLKKAGAL